MTRSEHYQVSDIFATILASSLLLLSSNFIYSFYVPVEGSSDGSIKMGNENLSSLNNGNWSDNININDNETNSALIMATDKTVYDRGEPINITVSNTGNEQLTFPNSALGLTIRNALTNESYPIFSAQVITTLDPGDSKSVAWDQTGGDGNQVPKGDYIVSLGNDQSSTDNVIFSVS